MYDVFYRFYPYKLFLAKEGQSAVEDILGTFSVLDNTAKKEAIVNSKISATRKADDLLEIGIRRANAETCFHVSHQHYLPVFAVCCRSLSLNHLIYVSCA